MPAHLINILILAGATLGISGLSFLAGMLFEKWYLASELKRASKKLSKMVDLVAGRVIHEGDLKRGQVKQRALFLRSVAEGKGGGILADAFENRQPCFRDQNGFLMIANDDFELHGLGVKGGLPQTFSSRVVRPPRVASRSVGVGRWMSEPRLVPAVRSSLG